ncbi:MAG: ribonuclease PH [Deltaproteobacteria bacterium]|nr:ribonuclease PH [Deltaproteobacteria bacterium]
MRQDGRSNSELRKLSFTTDFTAYASGSVLVETGNTRVLCTVCTDDGVPPWMRSVRYQQGWLTAEYSMLPGSTHVRSRRERPNISGRTQEIQRLIGRSLRGIMDLKKCPDMTFQIDCDVLQADGGTRTAAITGAWVALRIAVNRLMKSGKLKKDPIIGGIAAVSVGIREDQILLDLDYAEDSSADTDMNIVMSHSGQILEIQGTAEKAAFTKEQIIRAIDVAESGLQRSFELQLEAVRQCCPQTS